jgi:hypothetical protein
VDTIDKEQIGEKLFTVFQTEWLTQHPGCTLQHFNYHVQEVVRLMRERISNQHELRIYLQTHASNNADSLPFRNPFNMHATFQQLHTIQTNS